MGTTVCVVGTARGARGADEEGLGAMEGLGSVTVAAGAVDGLGTGTVVPGAFAGSPGFGTGAVVPGTFDGGAGGDAADGALGNAGVGDGG
jgi:hypothetical protein